HDAYRRVFDLALPVFAAMASQAVLNIVDTAMVGRLGSTAIAGVGIGSFLAWLCATVVVGMSSGVQASVARRLGEGNESVAALPLNAALVLVLALGIPTIMVLYTVIPLIMPFLADSHAVAAEGTPYTLARISGMLFLGTNFAFRAYWNATERPRYYLITLVAMHILNIFLNWVLIFGNLGAPELGTLGAGIGTAASLAAGTVMHFWFAHRLARHHGFLVGFPARDTFVRLAKLALPASVQEGLFAGGFLVFMAIIARIGTVELAAGHILIQLVLVWVLPAIACGIAAATLVGQTLGKDDVDAARVWGWRAMKLAMVVIGVMALPALVAPASLLSVLTTNAELIEVGRLPLWISAATMTMEAAGITLLQAHFGAGAVRRVLSIAPPLQWGLFLPIAALSVWMGASLLFVWSLFMGYRLLQTAILALSWRGTGWVNKDV
ncbi:MAG: MATE family efflux transporter, partial [Hyphomicrobiaceae bacterium]